MATFFRIITYLVILLLFSVLLLSLICFISNTSTPSFSDTIGVFSFTAAILGTLLIVTSIDDWKHQDNRRLERETALKLSETIDSQYISFLNLFTCMVFTPVRKDFCNYFDYNIYEDIPPSRYKLISKDVIDLANGTHQQALYSSRLIRFTNNKCLESSYNELCKTTRELYFSMKYIYDFKAENKIIINGDEKSESYKKNYDSLKKLVLLLDSQKLALDKVLDGIILIK